MVAAILLITSFQGWWLYKTYKEQQREMWRSSQMYFRESVWQLQGARLKLDSTERFRPPGRGEAVGMMLNMMRKKLNEKKKADTIEMVHVQSGTEGAVMVVVKKKNDSLAIKRERATERMIDIMMGADSLLEPLTIAEIKTKYDKQLQKRGMGITYSIIQDSVDIKEDGSPDVDRNEVVVGFSHPVSYKMKIENENMYLFKKLAPQIGFSLFLMGLTIVSFMLLYKNLLKQSRLTELKNDFINNITHELKTPIATVSVAIEALKNFNAMDNPERTREYLDISGNELNRLSMLVDKVLKMSMFEKSQLELKNEPISISALVNEVVRSMQLQFEKQHAVVDIKQNGTNFTINGDKLHITSVLYNLLDNALKYSKDDPAISIAITDKGEAVELAVTDNGIGISPAYKQKIFDKFFRVPHGDTHNIKGYGLGLSYVAQVIKEHGGSIDVSSEEEKGSTFKVTLKR
jgi:two-component system, OmpR family, phosphate regulon sensor histidine kinase PhoR